MSDKNEIIQTISTFYEIISGPKTKKRDWEKMRSLFYPGAVLFPNAVTQNPVISNGVEIETYIQSLERFLGQNDFFEQGSIMQVFIEGNIASVTSIYEARHAKSDQEPFIRGVNFVHLLHAGRDWKITSMIWRNQ